MLFTCKQYYIFRRIWNNVKNSKVHSKTLFYLILIDIYIYLKNNYLYEVVTVNYTIHNFL